MPGAWVRCDNTMRVRTDLGPLPHHPDSHTLGVPAQLADHRFTGLLALILLHDTSLVQDTVDCTALQP